MDLIILIFLTWKIGKVAVRKGLKPFTWRAYNVIGWLFFEIIGMIVGLAIFGKDNLVSVGLVGFTFAITSYFLINAQLNKLPDIEDKIDNPGN